ncbi:MAG TPA: choice-of-anchor D domain-containing protein [Terracidiphilus sp.]|nr:choice-of-anchor D domain-containing protein [Terracidiphilus sp.]
MFSSALCSYSYANFPGLGKNSSASTVTTSNSGLFRFVIALVFALAAQFSFAQSSTLAVSSTSVSFGNVNVGQSTTKTITLTSTGTSPVTISSLSVAGSLFGASGVTTPLTLNPGQTATLTLSFSPNGGSNFTGTLTIAGNSSTGNATVNMSGTGIPLPSSVTCSSSSMTGAGSDACTVNLNGAAPWGGFAVSLASNNAAVTVPASVTVPYNTTSATFNATVAAVTSSQTVTITATAGSSKSFALQLSAQSVGTLNISTGSISFGQVAIGQLATQSFTVTASGGTVVINSIASSGSSFSLAAVSLPLTLGAGQSATLNAQFDPTAAGAATGQLTISSHCAGSGTSVVSLSGTGLAYSINLTWVAPTPTSDKVVGYNVYRALSGSTTFAKMNSSLDAQTAFTDSTAQAGASYEYYVVSVDGAGNQSAPSNTFSVSIP